AVFLQRRDVVAQRRQPFAAQLALGAIHQQRGADLYNDKLGARKNSAHRRDFFLARLAVLLPLLGLAFALPPVALALTVFLVAFLAFALSILRGVFAAPFAADAATLRAAGL